MNENWVAVCDLRDLEGDVAGVRAGRRHIAIYRVDGCLFATDNICTHGQALLSDGWLEDGVIECPLHAGRFDVRTGKGLGPPIEKDIACYAVREVGGKIEVALSEDAS
jgi:naphthalene 1,2-dioxygenase system ferredoxin subunit